MERGPTKTDLLMNERRLEFVAQLDDYLNFYSSSMKYRD